MGSNPTGPAHLYNSTFVCCRRDERLIREKSCQPYRMTSENDQIEASTSSFDKMRFIVTRRRWFHILDRHVELRDMMEVVLSTASVPDEVFIDQRGTLHLVKSLQGTVSDFLVVIARKRNSKTYLVTAYYINSKRKERRYRKFKKLTLS